MSIMSLTPKQRLSYYKYLRQRRFQFETRAKELLGGICTICGAIDALRIQFRNVDNPLRSKYRTNPVTLYRRLCLEPTLRNELALFCNLCRLERKDALVND